MTTHDEPMYEYTAASHELAETPVALPDDDDAADEDGDGGSVEPSAHADDSE